MITSLLNRLSMPPGALVLMAIASVQLGSAIAKSLLDDFQPAGIVFVRVGLAAVVLLLLWRPPLRSALHTPQNLRLLLAFGLALALMNWLFYAAIARLPLGIAVAVEFTGPLGVAVAYSRQRLDIVWIGLAAIGILLLTPWGDFALDSIGLLLALGAGACWATYMLLAARTGQALPGGTGLAIAMLIAAIALTPGGIYTAGSALLDPTLMMMGFGVAMLSSAIPYSLELEALRHLPLSVFGVLMSLEPAMATLFGFLILGETLELRALLAIGLITIAAAGSARFSPKTRPIQ